MTTFMRRLIFIALILTVLSIGMTTTSHAQWPPFRFQMTPTHEDGLIIYALRFDKRVAGPLHDVTFNIPIPDGTRFVEASGEPVAGVSYDGETVSFKVATVHRGLDTLAFTVEITDPTRTEFTTQAWIGWQGSIEGSYLTDEITFDVSKPTLDWGRPRTRLNVEARATIIDDVITYELYPNKLSSRRMWDLTIYLPIPEDTEFIAAEAPAPFVSRFDGEQVIFSAIEYKDRLDGGPLTVRVSTAETTAPFVVTHPWAIWKNEGRAVGRVVDFQEDIRGGDIVVQPHTAQQVVADPIGDVPFDYYDLTSIALSHDASELEAVFYTTAPMDPEIPVEYILYLDTDCNIETGGPRGGRGVEYWVRYRPWLDAAQVYTWDAVDEGWTDPLDISYENFPDSKTAKLWIPQSLPGLSEEVCWVGRMRNRSEAFNSGLPNDWLASDNLTRFAPFPTAGSLRLTTAGAVEPWGILANVTPAPAESPLLGKLAIPMLNDDGLYETHIYRLPDGTLLDTIPDAHQPDFRPDGEALLLNSSTPDGSGPDTIIEYTLADASVRQVSSQPADARPAYDPSGSRLVYGNDQYIEGQNGQFQPYLFTQCSLTPPEQEPDPYCRQLAIFGKLIPAGHQSELLGRSPVWTEADEIVYQGCNSWSGYAACGIYSVPASSTRRESDGVIPTRLTPYTSDLPSDSQERWIAFSSQRDGDWEAYVMNLNGDELRNLSNSPASVDGLPTLSPDGEWVAFVSNRDGGWAVWAVPVQGGSAQKLLDLPMAQPFGVNDQILFEERISWGP